MILNNLAVLLVIGCIAQHVLLVECEKGQGRKGKGEGKGKASRNKDAPPETSPVASSVSDKGQKTRAGKEVFKGKFATKDKAQCTWAANGDDKFTLGVSCKKGGEDFSCEYTATPAACPQYASNIKAYWKQVARALKKQKGLCQDANAIIKTGMCKKAPKAAHFKLNPAQPMTTTMASEDEECKENVDHQKLAEEHCNSNFSSICKFLFSIIQNKDC